MRVSDALAELNVEMQVLLRILVLLMTSPAPGSSRLVPSLIVLLRGSELLPRWVACSLTTVFEFLRILISVALFAISTRVMSLRAVFAEATNNLTELIDELEAITAADIELWGNLVRH